MSDAEVWIQKQVEFPQKHQFHMRPAQRLVVEAQKFESEIRFVVDGEEWNAKSILELLIFAAELGKSDSDVFNLKARGKDAEPAVEAMSQFMTDKLFLEAA